MAISHSAISRRGVLLSLLLICFSAFSAAAIPAGNLNAVSHQNYQDKKGDKTKKEEAQKTDNQQVDPDKQAPQKPEIKQVPKARKQLKPAAVKPKVKPVRIVKPKIKKH
ncbi:hypothetical protein [Pedobacter psychroterrae]|uniref:Uncharacterized protein n=1 Tax=Pedobacter psychroterrae TaxID=2530453 RepID=A0A4R0NR91_9SPHI|nr:hypothetical protein [Pedobacter psychroterrae]TCD01594.1 hypothetical protein EZ437_12775 [Pedobacter psychroterrae]